MSSLLRSFCPQVPVDVSAALILRGGEDLGDGRERAFDLVRFRSDSYIATVSRMYGHRMTPMDLLTVANWCERARTAIETAAVARIEVVAARIRATTDATPHATVYALVVEENRLRDILSGCATFTTVRADAVCAS
jgi:hypothetical protein